MKRRVALGYVSLLPLTLIETAQAATNNRTIAADSGKGPFVAAPYVTAQTVLTELLNRHYLPAAQGFTQAAVALHTALSTPQTPWPELRTAWIQAMLAWDRLSAVAVGPLVKWRSARAIDFWPARPSQIAVVLETVTREPEKVLDMEIVSATARGLPALEWILYRHAGNSAERQLATSWTAHVMREAHSLEQGFSTLLRSEPDESQAWTLYGEWFGQALGAVNQLRIKRLVADTRGKDTSPWVRGVSGQTRASWSAQAGAIESFLIGTPPDRKAPGSANALCPIPGSLDSLLLGRGHIQQSQTLRTVCGQMVGAVNTANPRNPASCRAAQRALANCSTLLDHIAGDVLQITLGFTDADGD